MAESTVQEPEPQTNQLPAGFSEQDAPFPSETFVGLSEHPITDATLVEILHREPQDDELDMKPDGAVFMSHVYIRRRLSAAFGIMGWGMRPLTREWVEERPDEDDDKRRVPILYQWWALYVNGSFVSHACGAQQADSDNKNANFADWVDGAKSNALLKCIKDLNVASHCWDRRWADAWRHRMGVQVWVGQKKRPQWRRIDGRPFYGERGPTDDSPNKHHAAHQDKQQSQGQGQPRSQGTPAQRPAQAPSQPRQGAPTQAPKPEPRPQAPAAQTGSQAATPATVQGGTIAQGPPSDPIGDEVITTAEVYRTGQGKHGPWELYRVVSNHRTYAFFSDDGGRAMFEACQKFAAERTVVDIDFEKKPRQDKPGAFTNTMKAISRVIGAEG